MTPADLEILHDARELLATVSDQLVGTASLLNRRIPDLAELQTRLSDRDDGAGTWLDDDDLTLLLLASGYVLMTVRQGQLRTLLADAGATSPEMN